jgi:hypothetical protein
MCTGVVHFSQTLAMGAFIVDSIVMKAISDSLIFLQNYQKLRPFSHYYVKYRALTIFAQTKYKHYDY